MTSPLFAGHPFDTTVTEETLRDTFTPLTQWEDKYRQLILLDKQLPVLPDMLKAQVREISDCENRVWLGYALHENGTLHFFGDSESRIVRGLLAVLLTAVEGKTATELLTRSPMALFDKLGLHAQLSASRSQGLHTLNEVILEAAQKVGWRRRYVLSDLQHCTSRRLDGHSAIRYSQV